jgi:hypothetical protein
MDVYSQEWNTNIALKCDFHFLILSNITFVSYEGGITPSGEMVIDIFTYIGAAAMCIEFKATDFDATWVD